MIGTDSTEEKAQSEDQRKKSAQEEDEEEDQFELRVSFVVIKQYPIDLIIEYFKDKLTIENEKDEDEFEMDPDFSN